MAQTTKAPRHNRTITVDFQDPSPSFQLISDGKAFVECVLAFLLSLGFELTHQATCTRGGSLTRHSHSARVRLGGLPMWRSQCPSCTAVFTVLPHFVLRYRRMRPDVARQALIATHGGLSLAWCATIGPLSRMVKKLELGFTLGFRPPPSPTLWLACCLLHPAYSPPSEGGTVELEGPMSWKTLLAYITGTVDQELLVRNEYLVTENRILRSQIKGRLRLSDGERKALAEIGQKLGKQALKEVAKIVKPDTILGWHRQFVAQKFNGSRQRKAPGRPTIDPELEALVVRMASENRSWGYDRIVGALANLGHTLSDQTVGNILKRHGLPPAPERKTTTTWKEFIRTHMEVLVATDFFTAEVWTLGGLVTYYVLFFIHLESREIHVAGVTPHPNEAWMVQVARNVTMEEWGFLSPGQYLIHDRDGKYCPAFQHIIEAAGVTRVPLPPRSPNLNAYAERWVRSVKEECLSRLILFGEASLRHALAQYMAHFHHERNHQGKGNVLLFPAVSQDPEYTGPIQCRERLGGLLKYYTHEAA